MGHTYRISISTGRTFVGSFLCIDPQGNLILDQTVEYEGETTDGPGRDVGMVLIPRKWWSRVERQLVGHAEEGEEGEAKGCKQSWCGTSELSGECCAFSYLLTTVSPADPSVGVHSSLLS